MTKVMVLGLRAFIGAQGGIETHVRDIVSEIVTNHSDAFEVEIIERKPYVISDRQIPAALGALRLTPIWAPRSQNLETIIHTFLGVVHAAVKRPDILHIHGIGPAIMTPLAKALGLTVVVTHHGEDFAREKWGWFARTVLKLGEWCAAKFSDARIVIAPALDKALMQRHNRVFTYIPNAVPALNEVKDTGLVESLGLQKGKYILHVGRIVPEKRQLDIINAAANIEVQDWKLALVGSSDHDSPYMASVSEAAARDSRVLLAGALSKEQVNELYASALAFVLPSTHEGLPIALLEAMSHNLPIVITNLPSLVELKLPESTYINVGDVAALQGKMASFLTDGCDADWSEWLKPYAVSSVADRTIEVYKSALSKQDIVIQVNS